MDIKKYIGQKIKKNSFFLEKKAYNSVNVFSLYGEKIIKESMLEKMSEYGLSLKDVPINFFDLIKEKMIGENYDS